jgi:hypothetical protein
MLVSPPSHHLKAHIKPTKTPTPPIDIGRPFPADEVRVVVAAGAGFVPLGLAPVLVTLPVPLVPVLVPLPLLPLAVALVLATDCEVELIVTLGQTSSPSLTIHIGVPVYVVIGNTVIGRVGELRLGRVPLKVPVFSSSIVLGSGVRIFTCGSPRVSRDRILSLYNHTCLGCDKEDCERQVQVSEHGRN